MSQSRKNKAVALRYRADEDMAPVVIASGCGKIAENIIEIAEQKGIPVFRDDSAASLMCMLEVGRSIPPELYEAIAVIYGQILKISADIKHSADAAMPNSDSSKSAERIRAQIRSKLAENTENK